MRMSFEMATLLFAWSTASLADTCEETDAGYRCFLESDDAVPVLEGVYLGELEPQWKIKIPKKIGGTVGEVIGKVTNPIKDNVTAPIADAFSGLSEAAIRDLENVAEGLARSQGNPDQEVCTTAVAAGIASYAAAKGLAAGPAGAALGAFLGGGGGILLARSACKKVYP